MPTTDPWRKRDTLLSPASAICGVLLGAVVIGVATYQDTANAVPAAVLVLGILLVIGLISAAVLAHRGHRGACLVRRAAYCAVAVPGLPVRVAWAIADLFSW